MKLAKVIEQLNVILHATNCNLDTSPNAEDRADYRKDISALCHAIQILETLEAVVK